MNKQQEALRLALEALKELVAQTEIGLFAVKHDHVAMQNARQAITALREALAEQPAQPAQEFVCSTGLCHYKTQRTWVGLQDDEIYSVLENLQVIHHRPPTTDSRVIFARAIEAKLRSKNENRN
jgi:hypothetical protein